MSKNQDKNRRTEEARRKAWMKRRVPRSGTDPNETEYRKHLLDENEANVRMALEQAAQQGQENPVVFVIDCRDKVGYAVAAAWLGEDKAALCVAQLSGAGSIPTMTLAIPHAVAVELLKTLKCSPVALPKFAKLPPDGWVWVVVVAAGGNLFLQVQPEWTWQLAGYERDGSVEPRPDGGVTALDNECLSDEWQRLYETFDDKGCIVDITNQETGQVVTVHIDILKQRVDVEDTAAPKGGPCTLEVSAGAGKTSSLGALKESQFNPIVTSPPYVSMSEWEYRKSVKEALRAERFRRGGTFKPSPEYRTMDELVDSLLRIYEHVLALGWMGNVPPEDAARIIIRSVTGHD